jgi:hypothetical protein
MALYLAAPLSGIVDECSSPTAGEGGGVKKKTDRTDLRQAKDIYIEAYALSFNTWTLHRDNFLVNDIYLLAQKR